MRRALAAALALGVAACLLGSGPVHAAEPGPTAEAPPQPVTVRHVATPTTVTRRIAVNWSGTGDRRYTKAAPVPGIGTITLVCRPDTTIVRLYADDRRAETQMWMAKYEDKGGRPVVAVKNARIYTWANANDDGTGGTGPAAHEGLNQRTPVENYAKGFAHGVISQRPGRNEPVGDADLPPATSFELTWWWNGFDHPAAYQSCKVVLTLVTHLDLPLGMSWHGDDDAAGHDVRTATIDGLGELGLRCETTRQGDQTIWLTPASQDPDAEVYVEEITGEGAVEDHVDGYSLALDPVTGTIGPLPLPRNGMLRLWWTVDDVSWPFVLSSYVVANNAKHPELNLCEIGLAPS